MRDILSEIIANKQTEVERQKQLVPVEQLERIIATMPPVRSMRQALAHSTTGIIAEFKRRSPSKGWINKAASPERVVPAYAAAGAAAVSILTDEKFFGGSLQDIRAVRNTTTIPVLRKEFIIDPYQLYEARAVGADAVLLIAAALSPTACSRLANEAHALGLEVLLEIHNETELSYVEPTIEMVGVNNRNLGTFVTAVENSFRLAEALPKETLLVSESGISAPETVIGLRQAGFRGFLIGETFMKNENPGEALHNFMQTIR